MTAIVYIFEAGCQRDSVSGEEIRAARDATAGINMGTVGAGGGTI